MPRDACSVSGCSTVRTPGGLGIFRVSLLDDPQQQLWRDRIMNIMGSRVGGGEFNTKLSAGQALICERHFREDDIITFESNGDRPKTRRLKGFAIPVKNLPRLKTSDLKIHPGTVDDRLANGSSTGQSYSLKRKFCTIGVGTKDNVSSKNFTCQVGKSYVRG